MAQADQRTTTRRAILKSAPAVIAAAALPVASVAAIAEPDDPIFALIEEHRAAWLAMETASKIQSDLDGELPLDQQKTGYVWDGEAWNVHGEAAGDDTRWLQSWQDYIAASSRLMAAAEAMVDTQPTTIDGVIALTAYAADYIAQGGFWPEAEYWLYEGASPCAQLDYPTFLLRNIAAALAAVQS